MNREQIKTILWLRWRLSRNQWLRSGGLGAIIAALVGVGAFLLGGFCFMGAFLVAAFALAHVPPPVIMGIWFGVTVGFLFFWTIGLLTELQRSETIDLQRLMHLPVALGQMFTINYLVSHFTLSIVIIVPVMLGLALGLAFAHGPEMLLLIPLALSMVFMITAWTYCLRGWLAALMTNPRRRRTVIMCITLVFVLLSQAPNLYFNVFQHQENFSGNRRDGQHQQVVINAPNAKRLDNLIAWEGFIPPLWVSIGAQGLAEGHPLPALFGMLGCLGIATLGLRRAYRSTVRFYYGETGGKTAARARLPDKPAAVAATGQTGSRFLELQLQPLPEQAAALALASFRSMLRAPEVKMTLGSLAVVTVILGMMFFLRAPPHLPDAAKPFAATGAVVFSMFMLTRLYANQFGFDRDGFRTFIFSPADRKFILLGKNLACLPFSVVFGVMLLAFATMRIRLSPPDVLAGLFQMAGLLLIASLLGNLLSILLPYRIQPGSMKPTKMPGLMMLVMVLCQFLFPLLMAPVFVAPLLGWLWLKAGGPGLVPVNLILSTAFAALVAIIYWQTLGPLGRLLQRRETKILNAVTAEVE